MYKRKKRLTKDLLSRIFSLPAHTGFLNICICICICICISEFAYLYLYVQREDKAYGFTLLNILNPSPLRQASCNWPTTKTDEYQCELLMVQSPHSSFVKAPDVIFSKVCPIPKFSYFSQTVPSKRKCNLDP